MRGRNCMSGMLHSKISLLLGFHFVFYCFAQVHRSIDRSIDAICLSSNAWNTYHVYSLRITAIDVFLYYILPGMKRSRLVPQTGVPKTAIAVAAMAAKKRTMWLSVALIPDHRPWRKTPLVNHFHHLAKRKRRRQSIRPTKRRMERRMMIRTAWRMRKSGRRRAVVRGVRHAHPHRKRITEIWSLLLMPDEFWLLFELASSMPRLFVSFVFFLWGIITWSFAVGIRIASLLFGYFFLHFSGWFSFPPWLEFCFYNAWRTVDYR